MFGCSVIQRLSIRHRDGDAAFVRPSVIGATGTHHRGGIPRRQSETSTIPLQDPAQRAAATSNTLSGEGLYPAHRATDRLTLSYN
jgi:hypothetical protein